MPINQWRAVCRFCGKKVGKRKGFAGKSEITGQWLVWHGRCDLTRKPPPDPPPLPPKPYYVEDDD